MNSDLYAGGLGSNDYGTGFDLFDIGLNRNKANKQYGISENAFNNVTMPTLYTKQGNTEYDRIQEDPQFRIAQIKALQEMGNVANAGGNDAQYRQAVNQAQQQAGQYERGQREAMAQQAMQRRGFGGGAQLAQQMQAQQAGAGQAANQGFNAAAGAQQRALEAMQGYGQMAGQVRGQEYGQAAQRAQAQDVINRANNQGLNQFNQQNFENQMNLQGARANQANQAGGRYYGRERQGYNDLGNLVETFGKSKPGQALGSMLGL